MHARFSSQGACSRNSRTNQTRPVLRFCLDPKFKILKMSHRILRHLHEELNIDKIKKLIAQFACKLRDKSNEFNYVVIRH